MPVIVGIAMDLTMIMIPRFGVCGNWAGGVRALVTIPHNVKVNGGIQAYPGECLANMNEHSVRWKLLTDVTPGTSHIIWQQWANQPEYVGIYTLQTYLGLQPDILEPWGYGDGIKTIQNPW